MLCFPYFSQTSSMSMLLHTLCFNLEAVLWELTCVQNTWLTCCKIHVISEMWGEIFAPSHWILSRMGSCKWVVFKNINLRFEAFKAAKVDKTVSGFHPHRLVNNYRHFMDHVCLHHQGLTSEMISETSLIFDQLTWLIALEDFINI
jgi:hypothetical protein